jgi:hypothetical protein
MSHIHWVARGTGIPKDRVEVNRREVCECDEWVCDLDVMDAPSKLSVIRKAATFARARPTLLLNCWAKAAWRKWNWPRSCCASWTPEAEKKRSVSRWACKNKSLTNSLCNLPDDVGLGGRVQHSSFCDFFMLVICWTDQPTGEPSHRWTLSPVNPL